MDTEQVDPVASFISISFKIRSKKVKYAQLKR
jgi:hypothetical protein